MFLKCQCSGYTYNCWLIHFIKIIRSLYFFIAIGRTRFDKPGERWMFATLSFAAPGTFLQTASPNWFHLSSVYFITVDILFCRLFQYIICHSQAAVYCIRQYSGNLFPSLARAVFQPQVPIAVICVHRAPSRDAMPMVRSIFRVFVLHFFLCFHKKLISSVSCPYPEHASYDTRRGLIVDCDSAK